MSTQELATITAITGLVAALAAFVSAFAAWKAVSLAKSASQSAEMTEKRIMVREIVYGCRETINTATRAQDLAQELMKVIRDLAIFAGQSGSSRQKVTEGTIEKDREKIASAVEVINNLFSGEAELNNLEVEQLNAMYATMSINLADASAVREKFETKLSSLNEEVRPYREKAIST
ncbi:MAG: hypothetical protein RPU15_15095 [Candidatus Sedimenticola sp. (ex Thyasira tokunagai)]